MSVRDLAVQLVHIEEEDQVVKLLTRLGFWEDFKYWRPFGDNDNNFSTIGNQQSSPDAALVEKMINSVDAILMKECMIRGIDMESQEAPQSIEEALKEFFKIGEGQISYLDSGSRAAMAQNIVFAATGKRGHMNFTLVDRGEGQTPNKMAATILSVSRNNKLKIPFVQGKFNMGGTGVLPFCGRHYLQLVISKRCPEIADHGDSSCDEWSVTIVRRESPREGRKSSMFTYLTDSNGEVLRFSSEALPIIPTPAQGIYENLEFGTLFKMYNYSLQGYRSNILFDFHNRISMLIPELAHPIRFRECRTGYQGHSFETTMAGLLTRLAHDRHENIEDSFPSSETIYIDDQLLRCSIYVFKKDKSGNYRGKEGILFTVNGQTHATAPDSFFNKVNLSYLADSLLLLVDCSDISIAHREDMFMNSRDRLRRGEFVKKVEESIQDILRGHAGLKRIQNERRQQMIEERIKDDKPLKDVLENILKKSPVLSKILLAGTALSNPYDLSKSRGTGISFVGKKHPTYFRLIRKNLDGQEIKRVPINQGYYQVQFETDANNDYFSRPDSAGKLLLKLDGESREGSIKRLSLYEGTATLNLVLAAGSRVNDEFTIETTIEDECLSNDFQNTFRVLVSEEVPTHGGWKGDRRPPAGKSGQKDRETPNVIGLPNISEVREEEWGKFSMNKYSALEIKTTDEGSDYYINMDNHYLLTELKVTKGEERIDLTNARYRYGLALVGMGVESYYKNNTHNDDNDDIDVTAMARTVSSIIAPILIPMIESMADLDDEVSQLRGSD